MAYRGQHARLGCDIGGTFTDVVLEIGPMRFATKVLTRHDGPEIGVIDGIDEVLSQAGASYADLDLVVHGTTLATNALIERRGACVGLITTEGFRDTIEIRTENRFDQYDLTIQLPPPLVPRRRRFTVRERLDARGNVIVPLDDGEVASLAPRIEAAGIDSLAIGFLHSYVNSTHERRVRKILSELLGPVPISLSAEVSQEMREFERLSTTCANAYVKPLMAAYLSRLATKLREKGFARPFLLMLSGGGLTTVDVASAFPVRLVESGPAGGAVFAADVARRCGIDKALSFDMGGTTAKLCLLDNGHPQTSRQFEVARTHRFKKGSGLPLRIPVIEMVEIGAGGGSIARIDEMKRISVGPESAGSSPGPACYGLGGVEPTVTDANLALGRIDPDGFAGGKMTLDAAASRQALLEKVGNPLGTGVELAAYGVVEMVDENMANAARAHAIESGIDTEGRTMIVFGGGGPIHAARVAEKLGISRFIVPAAASVGSAVGFLRAPIAFEHIQSDIRQLRSLNLNEVNALLNRMKESGWSIVESAALGADIVERRGAYMRYVGQGHEIFIDLPSRPLSPDDLPRLVARFEERYRHLFRWLVRATDLEIVSWSVLVSAPGRAEEKERACESTGSPVTAGMREVYDLHINGAINMPVFWRPSLEIGARVNGPAIIAEGDTCTVLPRHFHAVIDRHGFIDCRRNDHIDEVAAT